MDLSTKSALIAGLFLFTMLLNLPFGYLRQKVKKFSFKWFLYIHLSIPIVFICRRLAHIEFIYVPVFITGAVIGQIWGGRLRVKQAE